MGIIVSGRMTERRKMEMRTKLFEELRKLYLEDGLPDYEANGRALAMVRAMKLK